MKFRLTKTEIQASRIERIVTRGIQRKVELLYKVLSLTGDNMAYTEVVPVFTRNFIMGESNEVTE